MFPPTAEQEHEQSSLAIWKQQRDGGQGDGESRYDEDGRPTRHLVIH